MYCYTQHNECHKHNFVWKKSVTKEHTRCDQTNWFMVLEVRTVATHSGRVTGKRHRMEEGLVTVWFLTWVSGCMAVTPLWRGMECMLTICALLGASMLYFNEIYPRRQNSLWYQDGKSRLWFGQRLCWFCHLSEKEGQKQGQKTRVPLGAFGQIAAPLLASFSSSERRGVTRL